MKRTPLLVIWLVVILGGSALLSYSSVYEVEVYRAAGQFDLRIHQVTILENGSSGDILLLQVNATCTNPSSMASFLLFSIDTLVFINGTQLQSARGFVGPTIGTIPPAASLSFVWSYYIDEAVDEAILQGVEASGSWSWYFWLRVFTVAPIRGLDSSMRSQPFEGVSVITVG
jgi:hypothetical protein